MVRDRQSATKLINHYTFDEILNIIGFSDESNPDLEGFADHQEDNPELFNFMILDYAIHNGNFEDLLK